MPERWLRLARIQRQTQRRAATRWVRTDGRHGRHFNAVRVDQMSELKLITVGEELPLGALVDSARMAEQAGAWDDALNGYRKAIARIQAGEEPHRGPSVLRWIGRVYFER